MPGKKSSFVIDATEKQTMKQSESRALIENLKDLVSKLLFYWIAL